MVGRCSRGGVGGLIGVDGAAGLMGEGDRERGLMGEGDRERDGGPGCDAVVGVRCCTSTTSGAVLAKVSLFEALGSALEGAAEVSDLPVAHSVRSGRLAYKPSQSALELVP